MASPKGVAGERGAEAGNETEPADTHGIVVDQTPH